MKTKNKIIKLIISIQYEQSKKFTKINLNQGFHC